MFIGNEIHMISQVTIRIQNERRPHNANKNTYNHCYYGPDASTHPKLKCMAMSTHSINNNDINNGKFIDDVLIIGNNK